MWPEIWGPPEHDGSDDTSPKWKYSVDPPAVPSYFQDLFASMIASMKAGYVELASKLENSNKELQCSIEKLKDSNKEL
jgi:hypothetical protein